MPRPLCRAAETLAAQSTKPPIGRKRAGCERGESRGSQRARHEIVLDDLPILVELGPVVMPSHLLACLIGIGVAAAAIRLSGIDGSRDRDRKSTSCDKRAHSVLFSGLCKILSGYARGQPRVI